MKSLRQAFYALIAIALFVALAPPAAAQGWVRNSASGSTTPSGAAGGDLAGTYPNPTVAQLTGSASTVTLVAGTSLGGAAGAGGLSLGSLTGATTLPTGNIAWTGASTKTVSLVSTGAGSSITLTAGAASTWSTSAGALTLNGTSGINLQNGGTTWADLGVATASTITLSASAPTIQWVKGATSPAINQAAQTTDTATTSLTIAPQAPFATATGANRTPGSLVVNVAAPTNGSTTEGGVYVQRGGTSQIQIGPYSGSYQAIWFGNANLGGASSYAFLGINDGSQTFLNCPSGSGSIFLRFAGSGGVTLTSSAITTLDNSYTLGSAAARWTSVNSVAFNVYAAASDANAVVNLNSSGQIVLRTSSAGSAYTISPVAPAAGVTYTIQDLGAASTFLVTPASVALGAGAAATLGGIGAPGPATAGQNAWLKIKLQDGTVGFLAFWK